MKNRLLIYFFYDKDGIVDGYIEYILEQMKPYIKECIFVSNGELQPESRKKIENISEHILCRENKGFDVWAYKEALEYFGWNNLAKFDEIIFMNFTIMGPVSTFDDMFTAMDNKNIDFWGITICHEMGFDPFGVIEYGYIPTHIQSHFIAVRKSLFQDSRFKEYWNTRPMINHYNEAVGYHEAIFTKKFADMGFKWDVYVDTRDMFDYTFYPLMYAPAKIISEKKCPIFKRKSFILDYINYLDNNNGESAVELMAYLKTKTSYDTNLIWDNILRTSNQFDIKNCLHLNYILPKNTQTSAEIKNNKIALMMHIYFEDLIDYCCKYAQNMPADADIYITTNTSQKAKLIEDKFKTLPNNVKVIVIENRGRDVSALLVGLREYVYNYDLICFAHDKKVGQLYFKIKGETFSNQCFENILGSAEFINNIINTFDENPRLGLLTPPPPQFAEYYPSFSGYSWGVNYKNCSELSKRMHMNIDIDTYKEPIAAFGSMFWFRVNALKPLFDLKLNYSDFPNEPLPDDGAISHAIERIHPFVVQSRGYYPAWIMTDEFAKVQITNLQYMLSEINKEVFKYTDPNYFSVVKRRLKDIMHGESLESLNNEINKLNGIINDIYNSKSWKITNPLRWLMCKLK